MREKGVTEAKVGSSQLALSKQGCDLAQEVYLTHMVESTEPRTEPETH